MGTNLFGSWLKQRRKVFDLRQEDLADRIGCSLKTIEKIEAGARRPSRQVAELLAEHLKVPPDERDAFVRFARLEHDASATVIELLEQGAEQAPWRRLHHHLTNLPSEATPLIGRDADTSALTGLLRRDRVRLVTLLGAPGIGKTSLAMSVASRLAGDFEDGVFFVALAPISAPDLVTSTVTQALGVVKTSGRPLPEILKDWLKSRRVLLVLDNFEQVLSAASLVSELISACPWLKVLVTSRAALRLRGERQFEVLPLALPEPTEADPTEAVARSPAVELFVERAQQVRPDFELTDDNAPAVAAICTRLDGLPLAIELAAAHARLLAPQAMLLRLDSRLGFLSGGPRDLPTRHQTLRAAIEWSYGLLDEGEQRLFARMGVFVRGCTLSAAEAVCNAEGDLPMSMLEGVQSLLDKSLLGQQRDEGVGGERPVAMLETVREYALERLRESGEALAIQRLHAEYCLALTEAAEPELRGPNQQVWLHRLDMEHDNIRTALRWAHENGEPDTALRMSAALGWYWELRGHGTEGREHLEAALSGAGESDQGMRARALSALGRLAYAQSSPATRPLLEKALALAREIGDKRTMMASLHNLGNVAGEEGNHAAARAYHQESLALSREVGDKWSIAWALMGLGHVANDLEDYEAARAVFAESLTVRRQLEDRWGIARSLNALGDVARATGEYEVARSLYEESLSIHRELGHKGWVSLALYNLGLVARHLSDYRRALELLREALTLFREVGDENGVGASLAALAVLAHELGNVERAARLFGAAQAIFEATGYHYDGSAHAEFDGPVAEIRAQKRLAADWEVGRAMTAKQAVAYALSD